jgi:hypothetical protein
MLISFLFFSSVLCFSFYSAIVNGEQKNKRQCLLLSWQHQTTQKKNLEKLLKLNPQALVLRKRWRLAKIRLAKAVASGNPVLIAAAQAQLLAVNIKKTQLASRQSSILLRAKLEVEVFKNALKNRIRFVQVENSPTGLAVEPDSISEVASPYRTQEGFSKRQLSGANWQHSVAELIPPFFKRIVAQIEPLQSQLSQKIKGQCHVTIERRSAQWFVTLTAAKS